MLPVKEHYCIMNVRQVQKAFISQLLYFSSLFFNQVKIVCPNAFMLYYFTSRNMHFLNVGIAYSCMRQIYLTSLKSKLNPVSYRYMMILYRGHVIRICEIS